MVFFQASGATKGMMPSKISISAPPANSTSQSPISTHHFRFLQATKTARPFQNAPLTNYTHFGLRLLHEAIAVDRSGNNPATAAIYLPRPGLRMYLKKSELGSTTITSDLLRKLSLYASILR